MQYRGLGWRIAGSPIVQAVWGGGYQVLLQYRGFRGWGIAGSPVIQGVGDNGFSCNTGGLLLGITGSPVIQRVCGWG